MCLFAILAGLAPRLAFAIYWIARPNVVAAAFGDSLVAPLVGWDVAAVTFIVWSWRYEWNLDPTATAIFAVRETLVVPRATCFCSWGGWPVWGRSPR